MSKVCVVVHSSLAGAMQRVPAQFSHTAAAAAAVFFKAALVCEIRDTLLVPRLLPTAPTKPWPSHPAFRSDHSPADGLDHIGAPVHHNHSAGAKVGASLLQAVIVHQHLLADWCT